MSKNVRYIHITDNIPENWENIIRIAKKNYFWYAYIYHDSDINEDGTKKKKHLHLVAMEKGGTTIQAHCRRFEGVCLPNCIEAVKCARGMVRYLIHKDDEDKFQYSLDDIVTSNRTQLLGYFQESCDDLQLLQDYELLRTAKISVSDFLKKYQGQLTNLNFYQKCQLFKNLTTLR